MALDRPPGAAPFPRALKLALVAALAVGGAAVLYMIATVLFHPAPAVKTATGPAGSSITALDPNAPPPPPKAALGQPSPKGQGELAPETAFKDGEGKDVHLSDYAGKVVVLNLWATWCAPCRQEMPTLAALSALTAAKPIKVLVLSVDKATKTDVAKAFIAQHPPLDFHQDASLMLPFALKPAAGDFPTTVIFDKTGRERARVSGDLDWSTPKVRRILEGLAAE